MVGINPTLQMAARIARMLGHLTIVGLGGGALPVSFHNPAHECSVAFPFWGSIPELVDVVSPRPGRSACSSNTSLWNAARRPTNCFTTPKSWDAPSSHPTANRRR